MSHQIHGDDPNLYPSGDLSPATIVLIIVVVVAAFAWVALV